MNLAQEFNPCPKAAPTPKKEPKRIPSRNVKRHKAEWKRAFHSAERADFIQQMPCIVTGRGPCENVHVKGGGVRRKADYVLVVPMIAEKHREMHRIGQKTFEALYNLNFAELAEEAERAWRERDI